MNQHYPVIIMIILGEIGFICNYVLHMKNYVGYLRGGGMLNGNEPQTIHLIPISVFWTLFSLTAAAWIFNGVQGL